MTDPADLAADDGDTLPADQLAGEELDLDLADEEPS